MRVFLWFIWGMLISTVNAQITEQWIESYRVKKTYKLAGIEIQGVENNDRSVIQLLSGLVVGDEISIPGQQIQFAVKKLWKQGLFETIAIDIGRIENNDVYLVIRVTERPRLSKFAFQGNVRRGEADDIKGRLKLSEGRVLTDYVLGQVKTNVIEFYKDKGYAHVEVTLEQVADLTKKTPHVILYIKVNKGDMVRIADVYMEGNTVFKSWKLRRKLEDSKRFRWYNPFNSGKYLEGNLKKALPAMLEKYYEKGYRDARVISDSVWFSAPHRVTLKVRIHEGQQFKYGSFNWFGNTKYRSGQLDTILNIKAGEIFNQSKLDQKLYMNPSGFDISSLYLDDGYLFFQLQAQERAIRGDSIDYDILLHEGKQAIINRVTVKGNDKTHDHVIYRQIFTRPGQLFRRSDIIRSNRELASLGFFNPEKINVVPTPNPADGTVDIEYTVEEKANDQIELSGGWGGTRSTQTGIGLIGTLGLTFTNFSTRNFFNREAWRPLPSGDGQRLSIRAQTNGSFYQSYNFSFTEPWLGGKKPNALTFSIFHTLFNTGGQSKTITDTSTGKTILNPKRSSMSIVGGSIGLGKRLAWPDNYFNLFANLNYNYYELIRYNNVFAFNSGYANDLNVSLSLTRNALDQMIFPKQGSNFSLSGQLTPPYSVFNGKDYTKLSISERYKFIEYQKYKITAEWFTMLTHKKAAEGEEARNLVLRMKVGYGFLGYYKKAVGYSPFERFYMGGGGMSGFQNFVAREIIALRGYNDNSVSSQIGDPIVARYTTELRYPISLNPQATLFALAFAEAGNSWSDFSYFNPFQVKRSAGIGVRIFLPMFGLIGFDYGWGFDRIGSDLNNGNGKGQFHFTIGATMGEL